MNKKQWAIVFVLCLCPSLIWAASSASVDVDAGRAIYRDGLRANGEPVTALVAGDVKLLGTQFSCHSCHGISGMGSIEGSVIVPAIAGPILFSPSVQPQRSAYDVNKLATVLRAGVTPSGRQLDRLMPRFELSNEEVAAVAAYLRTLSTGPSAGVSDDQIRFATVVTDDADAAQRDVIVRQLQTFVDEKNRQTRLDGRRLDRGTTPATRLPTVYREWILDVWELTGPEETWRAQLETYYTAHPVFAVLGGLIPESPGVVSQFCEANRLPCLLPSTSYPQMQSGDLYTLNFSSGLGLEADLIAQHLQEIEHERIVQVYCSDSARRAAERLRTKLDNEAITFETLAFNCGEPTPASQFKQLSAGTQKTVVVLWLDRKHLEDLGKVSTERLYLSSSLIGANLEHYPVSGTAATFLVHPFLAPDAVDPAFMRFRVWAKTRGIEITHPRLQGEAFFASLMMRDLVKHIDRFFIREYLLDLLNHAQGMAHYLPIYARATFGPEQRFLAKGGYVLPLNDGRLAKAKLEWLVP